MKRARLFYVKERDVYIEDSSVWYRRHLQTPCHLTYDTVLVEPQSIEEFRQSVLKVHHVRNIDGTDDYVIFLPEVEELILQLNKDQFIQKDERIQMLESLLKQDHDIYAAFHSKVFEFDNLPLYKKIWFVLTRNRLTW